MKLLYPEFLWALFAIIIPIIIHLFNFRKFKKEYFSNVELLKEIKLKTKNKSKLKHLLVLLTRILAILCLVIAFCQPYIDSESTTYKGNKTIAIYIDNSLSMDSKYEDTYLINNAKEVALNIIESYSPTDNFQILTNDFEGKHQRIVNQKEIKNLINQIPITATNKKLEDIYNRQKELLKNIDNNKEIFWLSDFQQNNFNLDNLELDTSIKVNIIPLKQQLKSNVYIDSLWFNSPLRQINKEEQLLARIINKSENKIEVKTNLKLNNEIKSIINSEISPNSSKTIKLNYSIQNKGIQKGEVYLSDYPEQNITFDDVFLFSYNIKNKLKILNIKNNLFENFDPIKTIFKEEDNYKIETYSISNIDYSRLKNYSLIIVENIANISEGLQIELKKFINNGGDILIIPNKNIDLNSYNMFFKNLNIGTIYSKENTPTKISKINKDDVFYINVFNKTEGKVNLPTIPYHYPILYKTRVNSVNLLTLENGNPYFSYTKIGKGKVYFIASNIENNTFSEHAIFVPTILKLAENSQSSPPLYYTIGENEYINISNINAEDRLTIRTEDKSYQFIPNKTRALGKIILDINKHINNIGHYVIEANDNPITSIAYNYNRSESDVNFLSSENIIEKISKLEKPRMFKIFSDNDTNNPNYISEEISQKKYWKYFIIATLILLLIEILIIRLLKI